MDTRGARRASRRERLTVLAVLAVLVAAALGACGAEERDTKTRPPALLEVSARVDSERVQVSPTRFGAGLVNFTVANLSNSSIRFTVSGPKRASTVEIPPGSPDYLRMDLSEGTYEVGADRPSIRPATIRVGAERPGSQNDLLLP